MLNIFSPSAICAGIVLSMLPHLATSLPTSSGALIPRADGRATFYDADGAITACGNTPASGDLYAAVSIGTFTSDNCGKTISVTNTDTGETATVTYEDQCASCGDSDLDISSAAFAAIGGDQAAGSAPITWSIN